MDGKAGGLRIWATGQPLQEALCVVEIHPAESGAPLVFLASEPARISISISHRDGLAMCAVAAPNTRLGCDLELIEAHSEAFIRDYFTEEEQRAIQAASEEDRHRMAHSHVERERECIEGTRRRTSSRYQKRGYSA